MLGLLAVAAVVLLILANRSQGQQAGSTAGGGDIFGGLLGSIEGSLPIYSKVGPNSDPKTWWNGIKPGTVTLGGKPAPAGWDPGNMKTATQAAGFTGTGIGAAEGISVAVSGGGIGAGTAAGVAIPIIGAGVAIVGTVLAVISAHHQAALQREGATLNQVEPATINAFVMVLQAALHQEILSVSDAKQHTDQIVADYYTQVKTIQRGTWAWTADYTRVGVPTQVGKFPEKPPGTCNAACVVGHYWVERGAQLTLAAVQDVLAGNHGVAVYPTILSHDTQSGFPEVRVVY